MKYQGVIFDLDGTLLDTLEDLAFAANSTLAAFGFPQHQTADYRYFVGEGLNILMRRIIPPSAVSGEMVQNCMKKFSEIYKECWNIHTVPYRGVPEMIAGLSAAGVKLAVLSNKPHAFTQICVKSFFPNHPFLYVYGQRDGIAKKPDPAGALELAARMKLSVDNILYVGDTATDMQTGNRAGMKTIGVEWGFRDREELEKNKAWKIAAAPAEIVSYVI
ncbi:Phosphoglycolate phosphatase [hydrothermal vent metagenome]|uniref:Phosphoglycolate phosphatase n=1 Tax=hydrothermal vent metagenome TaxID=652676 RepID=A0A3B0WD54_9ZZZZ